MFVTVTTVDTAGEPIETAPIVAEEMERWLRDAKGFEGFLLLAGEGKAIGLSFWESRETAERHRVARTQFRERMLSIAGVRIIVSAQGRTAPERTNGFIMFCSCASHS